MRAFRRRRRLLSAVSSVHSENPLTGVANLFDASIVFAVGLMVALVQAFSMTQLLDPNSEFTLTRRNAATGEVEIVEKVGKTIKVRQVTQEKGAGQGTRLGVAYQLPDGSVIYVPEDSKAKP